MPNKNSNLKQLEDTIALKKQNVSGLNVFDQPEGTKSKELINREFDRLLAEKNKSVGKFDLYEGASKNVYIAEGGNMMHGLKYDKYLEGYLPWQDPIEYKAQQQSVGQQLGNGALRLAGTTITKLGTMAGYIGSFPEGLLSGNWDNMLDNAISEVFSNIEEDIIKENLPIHHTRKYLEGNILQQMSTFGFWMDDMVDGVAFLASAYLMSAGVGAAMRGIGALSKVSKTFSKLNKAVKTGNVINPATKNIRGLVTNLDIATMSLFNSVGEAGIEASEVKKSLMAKGLSNEEASKSAMNTFWTNVGALMVPNMITNSMFFKPFKSSRSNLSGIFKDGKLIKEELKDLSTKDLAGIFAKKAGLSMASEGLWEENIQLAAADYEEKLALGKEDRDRLTGIVGNMFNNLFTDEGQKSIVLGSLIGLIPGGYGGVKKAKAERAGLRSTQTIMGLTLAGYENQIQDFYERDSKTGAVVLDETQDRPTPKLDYGKIEQAFNSTINTLSNIGYSIAAAEAGNETMFEFLREERFASLALNFLSQEDGLKHLKNQIDLYAQQEVEDLERTGNYLDKDTVDDLKFKYKNRADLYKKIYDSIANNYLAFPEFEDGTKTSNQFKNRLLISSFMEAVNQNFWADKKNDLEAEIAEIETSDTRDFKLNQDRLKKLNKVLEDVNTLISESQDRFKDIVSPKKQKEGYAAYKSEIDKLDQKLKDKSEKDKESTTEIPTEEEPEKPKAETEPSILTDREGKRYNYIGYRNKKHRVRDLETGELEVLSSTEFQDRGFSTEDVETGDIEPLGNVYVDEKGDEFEYTGKKDDLHIVKSVATDYEIPMSTEEFEEFKKLTTLKQGTIDDVETEVENRSNRKESYKSIIKDRIKEILSTTEEGLSTDAVNELLLEEYGDPQYDEMSISDLLEDYILIDFIPIIYNGKVGELSRTDENIIFTDINGNKVKLGELSGTLKENGIRVFKNFAFDVQVVEHNKLSVNGTELKNTNYIPTDAIVEDKNGNPVEIRLRNNDNKLVSITNPLLVYDLANAIYTIEELRNNVLGIIKEGNEDFIYVKDPESNTGNRYAVYNIDGMWRVINPETGKGYFKTLNDRILEVFHKELNDNLANFADLVKTLDFQGDKLNKKELKDELNSINDIIESATPAEINESKSAAEVPSSETKRAKEAQETDEQGIESPKEQSDILEDKAEDASERQAEETFDDTTPGRQDRPKDTLEGLDPVSKGELKISGVKQPDATLPESGLRAVADAVSYQYEENSEFDEWVSKPENSLKGKYLEVTFASDLTYPETQTEKDPWKKYPKEMKRIQEGNLTDEELDSLLEAGSDTEFGYLVDILPIRMVMKDAEGNKVPGKPLYYHVSNWWNVRIPKKIAEQGEDAIIKYKRELWIEARGVRRRLLKDLFKGKKLRIEDLSKTMGHPNTVSPSDPNRNSKLTAVFKEPLKDMRLSISNNTSTIVDGTDNVIPSIGAPSPGSIFYATKETCNGELFPVMLNPTKLSREHAKILLKALIVAYDSKGGRSTVYPGDEVENLTVGEVIQLLVLEGENFTRQDNKETPIPYLLDKQLYVKNKVIYFGKNGKLAIDPKKRTDKDIEQFITWATTRKNYVIVGKKLARPIKKDFKIGSLKGKRGQLYDSFVISNGLIKTDLTPGLPFHAPVVVMNPYNYKTRAEDTPRIKPEIAEEKPKEDSKKSSDDILDELSPFRERSLAGKRYTLADTKKELKWLKKRLSDDSVQLVDGLININGKVGFGALTKDAILLSNVAEEGTLYHEAFHRVSLGYLTEEQRQSLYNPARKRYNLKNASDRQVEEKLAEEFRNYVLTENKAKAERSLPKKIADFFKDLWNNLIKWFNKSEFDILSDTEIEKVFEAINKGEFKNAKPKYDSDLYRKDGITFLRDTTNFTAEQIRSITKNIVYLSFALNNVHTLTDLSNIKYSNVKSKIAELRGAFEAEGNTSKVEVFDAILDNFDEFVRLSESYLTQLKVYKNLDELDDLDKGLDLVRYDEAPYETDIKDNILSAVKLMVMTLPEGRDDFTGMFSFVDFNPTFNRLLNDLHNFEDAYEMMDFLNKMGENYAPYKTLYKRLSEEGELLRTQFEVSLKSAKHKFIDITYELVDSKPVFNFQSTDVQKVSKKLVREWNEIFYDSNMFEGKYRKLSEEKIQNLSDRFKDILPDARAYGKRGTIENFDKHFNNLIDIFNELAIPLDNTVLNTILASKKGVQTREEAFSEFVLKDVANLFSDKSSLVKMSKGQVIKVGKKTLTGKDVFTDEKVIDEIAQAYILTKPEEMSSTVLGPGGNAYYSYTQNTYVTDIIRELNSNPEKLDEMLSSVYSSKSYILNSLKISPTKRRNFGINTFSGFIQLNAADSGREYTSLNDIENILLKITAIQNGMLPMPTLADRRTYYLYKGVDPLSCDINVDDSGNISIDPNSEVVNVLMQYAEAENERIELAKEQIEAAFNNKGAIDTSRLVENFHYKISNNKGDAIYYEKMDRGLYKIFKYRNGKYAGNGTKFQHFKVFNGKEGFTKVREKIINALEGNIDNTISMVGKLGIINTGNNNSIVSNELLDSEKLKKLSKENYNGVTIAAIYKTLADYTANTIAAGIETEMIFSGDVAFYKGDTSKKINADKVKRISVATSTGTNTRTNFSEDHELYGKYTYNAATLNTDKIDSVYYNSLYERHLKYYVETEGLTEDVADKLVKKNLKNYRKTDPTDAQVYISPSMAKSLMIRWGEFTDEMSEAFDILESEEKPSVEDEKKALDLVMPVLKTVYFEIQYRDGLGVPIFDKMSMAPLFRRVVEGTDLERLADRMGARKKVDKDGNTLYDYTDKESIQAIKHDTAVKVGNMGRFNYYRDEFKTEITDFNERDLEYHPQKFKYLRKQLVTDPHLSEDTLFGTQVKKIIMSNIDKNATYKEGVSGQDLINTVMESVSALSEKGKERLLKKLGVTIEGGKLDSSKLLKMLREDARKSGMSDNIVRALIIEDGKIKLPFDALPERKWIYSRFISMINKHAVDLMLPGGSFIQMSNFGLKTVSDKNIDNFENKVDWFENGTNELKFYRTNEETGDTMPMECIVSINMFKHIIPNYSELSFEEKKKFVENNPEIIGYRIPTQGMNSVSYMKVVGLLPENVGDVIILPAEFTTLTGSDFDIDKLYAVRYNYDKTGKEITDVVKTPYLDDNNSTTEERARKYAEEILSDEIGEINKRISLRIREEAAQNEMTKSEIDELKLKIGELEEYIDLDYENEELWRDDLLDAKELKSALYDMMNDRNKTIRRIRDIREKAIDRIITRWVKQNLKDFSQRSLIEQNTSKAVENKLLDAYMIILRSKYSFINMTTPLDASTSMVEDISKYIRKLEGLEKELTPSLYELSPEYQEEVKRKYSGGKLGIGPFALNNVHHILGQIVGLGLKTNIQIGNVNSKRNTDLSGIKDSEGNYILDWLSALINAHVDIAKDPYIFDLNVNKRTYSITNLLIRSGVGEKTFYFLAQPILKELTYKAALKSGRLVTSKTNPGTAVRKKYEELFKNALYKENKKSRNIKLPDSLWDMETLINGIDNNTTKDAKYYKTQLKILELFQELDKQANYLNELVMASRTDTKGYGKNNAEMKAFTNTYDKVFDTNAIDGAFEIFNDTFLGTYYENSIGLSEQLFGGLTVTNTRAFKSVLSKVLELTGNKYTNDATLISYLEDEMFSMVSSQFFTGEDNGLGMDYKKVEKLFFSEKGLVNNIYELKVGKNELLDKYPELRRNRLIQTIQAEFSEETDVPDKLRVQNSSIKEKWDKEDLSRSWSDLIYHEDETVRKLGRGLVLYAFYSSGLSRNMYSFFEYMPTDYLEDIGFGEFFRQTLNNLNSEEGSVELSLMLDDLFKNAWIRHKASNESTKRLVPIVDSFEGISIDESFGEGKIFILSFIHNENSDLFRGYDEYNNPIYAPYFASTHTGETILYRYIGRNKNGDPIYRITSKKGYYKKGFAIKEYGLSKSIIKSNNIYTQLKGTNERIQEFLDNKVDEFTPVDISELKVVKNTLDNLEANNTQYRFVLNDKVSKEAMKEVDNNRKGERTKAEERIEIRDRLGNTVYNVLLQALEAEEYSNISNAEISAKLKSDDNIEVSANEIVNLREFLGLENISDIKATQGSFYTVKDLARDNKGRKVRIKYDTYKNSFEATVTGETEMVSIGGKQTNEGKWLEKIETRLPQFKTNTGKLVTAWPMEVEGLINDDIDIETDFDVLNEQQEESPFITDAETGHESIEPSWEAWLEALETAGNMPGISMQEFNELTKEEQQALIWETIYCPPF